MADGLHKDNTLSSYKEHLATGNKTEVQTAQEQIATTIDETLKQVHKDLTTEPKDRVIYDTLIENLKIDPQLIVAYFNALFVTVFPQYIKERITFDSFLSDEDIKVLTFNFNDRTENDELYKKKTEVINDIGELYGLLQTLSQPGIGDTILDLLLHPEKANSQEFNFITIDTNIPQGARRLFDNLLQEINEIQRERDTMIDEAKTKMIGEEKLNSKEEKLLVESLKRDFLENQSQVIFHYLNTHYSQELFIYLFKFIKTDNFIRSEAIDILKGHIKEDNIPEFKNLLSKEEYAKLKSQA